MNTPYMAKITVTADYAALVATKLVLGAVTISCPPSNKGVVNFKGTGFTDVPWVAGEWHTFHGIDLALIQVKGTANDLVTLVGSTDREGGV